MEQQFYKEGIDKEEDEWVSRPPYHLVKYIDDYSKTHMAMIKDDCYLHFIQDRFTVVDCQYVAE